MKNLLLVIATATSLSACGSPTGTDLPPLLAMRDDAPYITGRIITRWTDGYGAERLLVEAPEPEEVRVGAAVVTIDDDAMVLRRDGSQAGRGSLQIGRDVTVWTTGVELRSLPPQVTGSAFLLHP